MIGFDRSAFAASPRLIGVRQSKCESSECSIHNEGLPEHPIKNSNRTSVTPSVVSITSPNLNKRFCGGASLQLLFRSSPSHRPGGYHACFALHLPVSLTGRGRFNSINTTDSGFSGRTGPVSVLIQRTGVDAARDPLGTRAWPTFVSPHSRNRIGVRVAAEVAIKTEPA
jgi:hypothetical protein